MVSYKRQTVKLNKLNSVKNGPYCHFSLSPRTGENSTYDLPPGIWQPMIQGWKSLSPTCQVIIEEPFIFYWFI